MSKNQSGLSLKNRVAYAGTDAAGNLLYCTLTSFINYYHTDVFGISIGTAAVIALLVRIIQQQFHYGELPLIRQNPNMEKAVHGLQDLRYHLRYL